MIVVLMLVYFFVTLFNLYALLHPLVLLPVHHLPQEQQDVPQEQPAHQVKLQLVLSMDLTLPAIVA